MLLRLQASIKGDDVEARKKAYLQLLQDSIIAFLTQRASERPAPASDDSDDDSEDEEDLDDFDEDVDDDDAAHFEQDQDSGQVPQPRPPPHDPGPAPPLSTRKRTSRPSEAAN